MGYDVRIFMPKYGTIDEKKFSIKPDMGNLKVPTGEAKGKTHLICNVKVRKGETGEPTVYFLENMEYYEQRANVYNYADDPIRFSLLSRGAIEFLHKSEWIPDVIHANDWHTGYLICTLRNVYKNEPKLEKVATVFTIHNLGLQGVVDFRYMSPLDMDDGKGPLASFFSERLRKQNALKRGIIYADLVNTVSETHSHEIMTPEYGVGLEELLKEVRAKLFGVLNGLDYDEFNPETDKYIKKNFSLKHLNDRAENKIDLQKEFNLPVDPSIPILTLTGRLTEQKGIELLIKVMPNILKEYGVQFIILGEGDMRFKEFLTGLGKEFPQQVGLHLMPNWQLPRKIFSGSDMVIMPSKFEPGGIVAIEAMRYGAVPIVRATGGLADTVIDFDIVKNTGNGFVFKEFTQLAFFGSIVRALEIFKHKKMWLGLVKRAMESDYSWDASARKYADLYSRALDFRKELLSDNPAYLVSQVV